MTGGTLRGSNYALVGSGAEQSLQGLRVSRAFLSGSGLTAERGLSTSNMLSASVDRALVQAAPRSSSSPTTPSSAPTRCSRRCRPM